MNIKINKKINNTLIDSDTVRPGYDESLNFGHIPSTIKNIFQLETFLPTIPSSEFLSPDKVERVALIFIDNLGWNFFQKYQEEFSFLNNYEHQISQITSQFPSTTAAHVTTIRTGLPIYEHGIYEWFMYHNEIDEVINPFMLNTPYDDQPETLLEKYTIDNILPQDNFFSELFKNSITPISYVPNKVIKSAYNQFYDIDNNSVGYTTLTEGLTLLSESLKKKKKSFHYFYYPGLDEISHKYGPNSTELKNQLNSLTYQLESFLLKSEYQNTLILICSDHGQVEVSPNKHLIINKDLPDYHELIYRNISGIASSPIGSPRDFFLKPKNGDSANEFKAYLSSAGHYQVLSYGDLVKQKFIKDTNTMRRRLSDLLLILPEQGYSAFIEDEKFKLNKKGHHGGLSSNEMYTPLISIVY